MFLNSVRFANLPETICAFQHTHAYFCLRTLQQQHTHTENNLHHNHQKQDIIIPGSRFTESNEVMVLFVFLDHAHGYFSASDWRRDCHCPWGMSVRKLKITAMMQVMRQKAREDDSGDCIWRWWGGGRGCFRVPFMGLQGGWRPVEEDRNIISVSEFYQYLCL